MAQLAIEPYLKVALAGYETSCYSCDVPNVIFNYQFKLPYKILSQTNSLLRMDAIVPSNGIQSGHRAIIELVRSGESWKIKSYTSRSFTEDPIDLTIEESLKYLEYAIPTFWREEVRTIKHIGKEPRFGTDLFLVNGKDEFIFNVNTVDFD
jgi:hypothetical protein